MITVLAVAWGSTLLASAVLDMLAKPTVASWSQRTARAVLLHIATITWLYVLFLSLWGRAWFTLVGTIGLLGLLMVVNNAKFKALREPVVFSDLALFAQSIRHPRLYFPHLSWMQILAVAPAIAFFGLTFWLDREISQIPFVFLGLLWIVLSLLLLWLAKGIKVTFRPEPDQAEHGYLCVFVTYLVNGLSLREIRRTQTRLKASPYGNISIKTSNKSDCVGSNAPDVVVVQSESFFDIRKTGLNIVPSLLRNFDTLKLSGICSGELDVPAWGANTMRTEHAFLSGLPNAVLGYARFYPYAFVTRPAPAMPRAFQDQGYHCAALHPYPSDFFLRHKVFPRLGFDEFVDEAHFANAINSGPYISDAAVTDWLIRRLDQPASQPQFLFAITMENHGPLHLEKATVVEAEALYKMPNGQSIEALTVYLRHLANANKMLGRLQDYLASRKRQTLLCFYGDHVPAMSHVYEALNSHPHNSDYLMWGNYAISDAGGLVAKAQCLTPEQLGLKLAHVCGVIRA